MIIKEKYPLQKVSIVTNIHTGNRLRCFLHHLAEFKCIQLERTDRIIAACNIASLQLGARCTTNGLKCQVRHLLTSDITIIKCVLHNLVVTIFNNREHEHRLRL